MLQKPTLAELKKTIEKKTQNELVEESSHLYKMFSNVVEGLNTKIKLTMRKSFSLKTYRCAEISLYHVLGKLPEPKMTHRFY